MADNKFDLKGFLNDPQTQANKPAAMDFLKQKGIIDASGNLVDSSSVTTQSKSPGFLKSIAQGIATPFLKFTGGIRSMGDEGKSILQQMMGDSKGAAETQTTVEQGQKEGYDYGYLGKVKPLGSEHGSLKDVEESIGTGANIGATIGSLGAGKALTAAPTILGKAVAAGKIGSTIGGISGASSAMSEGKGALDVIKGGSSGTIAGAVAGALASPVIEGMISAIPKATQALQRVSMRLNPSDKLNLSTRLSGISDYMLKNNIVGTAEQQSAKLEKNFNDTENTLQTFFQTNAKDRFVDKGQLKQALESVKETVAKDNPDAQTAINQVNEAIKNLDFQYGSDKIPLERLNELKRNTYANAYNRAGTKVLGNVEHSIGDAYRTSIEDATKGLLINGKSIGQFNQEYGNLINARMLMQVASAKSPKLLEKTISLIAGAAAGSVLGSTGSAVGATGAGFVEKPVIEAATSVAGNIANRLSGPATSALLRKVPQVASPVAASKQ